MQRLLFRPRTRHDAGVTLTIWLLFSLGLGAATLLYTSLDRLLPHPLKVTHPETLVRAAEIHAYVTSWQWFPYSTFHAMQQMHSLQDVAVEGDVDTVLTSTSGNQPIFAHMVSGNYFSLMGATAGIGRAFTVADEHANGEAIPVVQSHLFWVSQFAGSPSVIGSTIFLQDHPFTVVGVMPRSFYGAILDSSPDLWLPLTAQPLLSNKSLNDHEPDRYFSIIARLKNGATLAQAQGEFSSIFHEVQKLRGDQDPNGKGLIVPIAQGTFALRSQFSHALTLLLCGLATLLLMICANVAGLLLTRQTRRERDIAVRMALSAGISRLVSHAFVESITLGLAGAIGGVLMAYLCAPLLMSLLPTGRAPLSVWLAPDWKIALMAALLAIIISLIFGVIPAWNASRSAPQLALRSGTATKRAGRLSRWLLVFHTGAALVLLIGTGLLIRTFYVLRHTSPGFDANS